MSDYETPKKSNNNNNNTNVIPEDDENTGQGLKRKKKMSDEGLSNFQINRIMKPYIQQGLYLGTVSRDEFDQVIEKIKPQSRGGFIFNTDPSTKPGQHWRAIFFDGRPKGESEIDYYDSYGASASKGDLKNIKKIADKLQANTYLKYKENKVVQQNNESANCGFFTVKFIIDRINGKHFTACSGWDEHVKGEKNIEKFKEQMGYGAPWKYVPSFGSGLLDSAKKAGLKTFQSASNAYRRAYLRKHPDANVRMLDLGELHYGLHNYTGPGTSFAHGNRDFKPYNHIDNASRTHDIDYETAGKILDRDERIRAIHEADKKAVAEYNKYKNEDGYLPAVIGIGGKYLLEKALSKIRGKPTTLYGGKRRRKGRGVSSSKPTNTPRQLPNNLSAVQAQLINLREEIRQCRERQQEILRAPAFVNFSTGNVDFYGEKLNREYVQLSHKIRRLQTRLREILLLNRTSLPDDLIYHTSGYL